MLILTSHQYVTEPNQPYSKNLAALPFWNTGPQSQTFGLEPNYPCCTVNHPQGYPKFLMYSFLRNGKNGIVHSLLSPGKVQTEVQGKSVSIDCKTDYPFGSVLSYTIESKANFQLYLRVPAWAKKATLQNKTAEVDPKTGLIEVKITPGTTNLRYEVGMELTATPRANDTVAVYRGAVLYAFYIEPKISSGPPKHFDNKTEYAAGTYPSQAKDFTLLNTTAWNIAIDPSTLAYHPGSGSIPSKGVFEDGKLPMSITVKACHIEWPLFLGAVPDSPIPKNKRKCLGETFEAVLRPYGSAKLHMSDLPTIDLSRYQSRDNGRTREKVLS